MTLALRDLGEAQDFEETWHLQESLVQQRREGRISDTLLLLEHFPVYTIGRTRDQSSLRDTSHLPHPIVEINRGGQGTYHGPGQLVGYAILDLNESIGALLPRVRRFCDLPPRLQSGHHVDALECGSLPRFE